MKRMLFVYNPKAGQEAIRGSLSGILEIFESYDYEIVVHPTKRALDAQETVERCGRDFDLIVCGGGDGTLDEVAAGMQRGGVKVPLGYIPAGSTNDFAASLGIPRQKLPAARSIMKGTVYPCDLGRLEDGYFVYVAAFGTLSEVSYRTSQEWKNMLGHLAYILEGVKSLANVKSWQMRWESEEYSGSGDFLYGMVTNSNSVAGIKGITGRNVDLSDGILEVTLIKKPDNFTKWPAIVNAVVTGESNECVVSFKTAKVSFFAEEEVPWTRDGEYGGSHKEGVIEDIPAALPIIIPAAEETKG